MNITLTIIAIIVVAAFVLAYNYKKKVVAPINTPIDNTPAPIEDENIKPEKPRKI